MDIHGGGFYMDCAARDDVRNRELAASLGIAVVSVDYRTATLLELDIMWLIGI